MLAPEYRVEMCPPRSFDLWAFKCSSSAQLKAVLNLKHYLSCYDTRSERYILHFMTRLGKDKLMWEMSMTRCRDEFQDIFDIDRLMEALKDLKSLPTSLSLCPYYFADLFSYLKFWREIWKVGICGLAKNPLGPVSKWVFRFLLVALN